MVGQMIFTMGAPGSGKSSKSKELYQFATVIDPDEIRKTLPGYDPKHGVFCHDQASQMAESLFQLALRETNGQFIVDGTGSNAEKILRRITQAKMAGFGTTLLYVTCSLTICLDRNMKRERKVPESLVREKYQDVLYSFGVVASHADEVRVIDNSGVD